MGSVIGDLLPLALGVAISPVPIIAAILMLLSPQSKSTSVGFLIGWVAGIVASVTLFTLLSSLIPEGDGGGSRPAPGVIKILIGLALVILAVRQWRSRPENGAADLPGWMAGIDSMTAGSSTVVGLRLSVVDPKNLVLMIGTGVAIGGAGLTVGVVTAVIVVFTIIAASTVLIPVVGYLLAPGHLRKLLERVRVWLAQNNAATMAVLLFVLGIVLVGKGIADF